MKLLKELKHIICERAQLNKELKILNRELNSWDNALLAEE